MTLLATLKQVPGYPGQKSGSATCEAQGTDTRVGIGSFGGHTATFMEATAMGTAAAGAPTTAGEEMAPARDGVSLTELSEELSAASCELAEGLVDAGRGDHRLTLGLAEIRVCEDDVTQNQMALGFLDKRETSVAHATRQRESALRFAISELQFNLDREEGGAREDVEAQISALSARVHKLLEQSEQELESLREQAIGLAATQSALKDAKLSAVARLQQVVDELLPQVQDDLSLAPLVDHYQATLALSDLG
jgi:hypothetical protein